MAFREGHAFGHNPPIRGNNGTTFSPPKGPTQCAEICAAPDTCLLGHLSPRPALQRSTLYPLCEPAMAGRTRNPVGVSGRRTPARSNQRMPSIRNPSSLPDLPRIGPACDFQRTAAAVLGAWCPTPLHRVLFAVRRSPKGCKLLA